MHEVRTEQWSRARDHYARELMGGRGFVTATWVSNVVLAAAVVGSLYWSNRVTYETAGKVQPYVVAFDSAAHPVPLNPNWTPLAGNYVDMASTFVRYARSRPLDNHVLTVQREWLRARTDRVLEQSLRRSLLALDEDLGGDGIEVELTSGAIRQATENGAVVEVRWRERTRFRSGGNGQWQNWVAMVALYFDPTRDRAEDVIPNPTRIYFTHFEPSPELAPIKQGR